MSRSTPLELADHRSMSRGTAMSISSSGLVRARHDRLELLALDDVMREAVEETTMSAAPSSDGRSSKRTAVPPKRCASPIARS